jgi:formiminotetrahydrofolate cyclodeaminase
MKKLRNNTLVEYSNALAKKAPTPGGGSAAALAGSLGAALICMVAEYSVGKNKSKRVEKRLANVLKKGKEIRKRLLECVDLDAQGYEKIVKARKGTEAQRKKAEKEARKIPLEVCKLCYKAVDLTPILVEDGNVYLISDVQAALEILQAAYNSALIMTKA